MPEPKWSGRNPASSSGGGATTLTELTDVTGTGGPGTSPVGDSSGVYPLTAITTKDDLQAVLDRVAAVDWHDIGAPGEPAFAANWRNIGEPWGIARYRVLANSTIRVEGTVTCDDASIQDATWVPIFQLPAELAPSQNLEYFVFANDDATPCRVFVWDDGTVIFGGYTATPHNPVERLPLNFLSWSTQGPAPLLQDAIADRFGGAA